MNLELITRYILPTLLFIFTIFTILINYEGFIDIFYVVIISVLFLSYLEITIHH